MAGPSPEGSAIESGDADVSGTAPEDDVGASRAEGALDEPPQDDAVRLEVLLAERARELGDERREVARLRRLLQDSVETFERLPTEQLAPSDPGVDAAPLPAAADLARERDRAVARALEAEARCAEVGFRLDEVMGHLRQSSDEGREELELRCAKLAGATQGLRAALAEVEETRDTLSARLLLLEHDQIEAGSTERALRREIAELREELELEILKERTLAGQLAHALEPARAAALKGELAGIRARSDEAERAWKAVRGALDVLTKSAAQQRRELGLARAELGALSSERETLEDRVGHLDRALARQSERVRDLSGDHERRDGELELVRAELARERAQSAQLRSGSDEANAERDRLLELLEAEREAARRANDRQRKEVEHLTATLEETRRTLQGLSHSVRDISRPEAEAMHTTSAGVEGDPTQPGLPIDIESDAGGDRARELEHRLRQIESTVRALQREAESSPITPSRFDELLSLLVL